MLQNAPLIIALSGRRGAGKNTIAKSIADYYCNLRYQEGYAFQPNILECSFADNIKQFCIETLGLRREQCYGSEDDKSTDTQYLWDNVPEFLRWKFGSREMLHLEYDDVLDSYEKVCKTSIYSDQEALYNEYYSSSTSVPIGHRSGFMSGRDIMQLFGTELIRNVFGNVWAAATIRKIKDANANLAIITDNRFPNEVTAVLNEPNGYIIRLTRSPFAASDTHASEVSLDNYNWHHPKCFVLDNSEMTLKEQDLAAFDILKLILTGR
jgi:hypothetical protein